MRLIDKDAVLVEIEKRIEEGIDYGCSKERINELKSLYFPLAHLEVKEVNLEKELNTWRHNHFHGRRDKEASGEYLERVSQLDLAKHFFELGLQTQKGK